jgi:fluoride ion exporter CrcB/FEX
MMLKLLPNLSKSNQKSLGIHDSINMHIYLFFAFLGCWMRIRLEKDTVTGGLADSDTAIFVDVCGNILGSFTIGALSTSTALGRGDRNVAIFPASWIGVQNNSELQLGMRTGFCGSLTTFSSWNQAMVSLFLVGTGASVSNAFFGYAMGLFMSLAAVPLGESFALYFNTYVHPDNTRLAAPSGQWKSNPLNSGDDKKNITPAIPKNTCCMSVRVCQALNHVLLFLLTVGLIALTATINRHHLIKDHWLVPTRTQCLSLLLAPVGAITRYELSKYNGMRKDFFVGTFAANLLACIVVATVYGIRDGAQRKNSSSDYSGSDLKELILICTAIGTGFGGCCSTVSTFMTDTIKLFPVSKDEPPTNAIRYVLVTIGVCCPVALIIYHVIDTNM